MTEEVEVIRKFQVGEYEKGVLLRDKKIIEILEPGMHIYNKRLNEKIELVKGSIVRENSIGIFTENGKYVGVLEPGVHYINPFAHESLLIVDAVIIDETQKGIELENGVFKRILEPGKYYENPLLNIRIIAKPMTVVEEGHEGLKLVNGILVEKLKPGIYFENHYLNEKILVVNLQIQTKELKEQTIITSDTVTIQIKSILVYQIIDSFKATCLVTDVDFSIREAIKVASQQVLSEYSLDECMGKKKLLSSLIKESVKLNCEKFGVEIDRIDIRDILITDADVSESLAAAAIARRNAESKLINSEAEVKSAELMRRAADELGTGSAIHIREMETMLQMAKNPNVKVHLILNQNMGKLVEEKITKEIIKQNAHDN
jgi:regulator of protease activity HflC (stomatin/prohibitin superfamily)